VTFQQKKSYAKSIAVAVMYLTDDDWPDAITNVIGELDLSEADAAEVEANWQDWHFRYVLGIVRECDYCGKMSMCYNDEAGGISCNGCMT
jgi:hypothetical protein